jgi:hypothetical protein
MTQDGTGGEAAQAAAATAVLAVLEAGAVAWSRGDLAGFMAIYEPGDGTVYANRDGVVRGYRAIHDMYVARFGAGRDLGRLAFDLVAAQPLGADHVQGVGRYRLARADFEGGEASGYFTVVLRRTPAGWRIVSDHAS